MKPAYLISIAGLVAVAVAGWLGAEGPLNIVQQDPAPQAGDPPARVARLNWLAGDVSFQPAGLEDWADATVNFPLTTSDHLFTGQDSRAEMHIGPNAIRLDQNSNFGFLNLDDSMVQVSLTQGSMEIRLNRLADDDDFEIATPNGALTLLRTGDYRVDTDADRNATMLTVRAGQAELYTGSSSVLIRSKETAYFRGGPDVDVRTANDTDGFDTFTAARDGNAGVPAPVSYPAYPPALVGNSLVGNNAPDVTPVSDEVTGAEDLNAYGSWQDVPGYGDVWVPPVDANWAPYSDGDWAYVEPWGWTWVDAAPWGFAPFHYGRWAYVRNHWVWVPGGRGSPVVYAPALVAFYGGGASGVVTWYPLGPRDVWNPPWRSALAVAANGGVSSGQSAPALGVLANGGMAQGRRGPAALSNKNSPGAIHTMSQVDFVGGNRVRPGMALAPEGQLLGSSPMLTPVPDSVLVGKVRLHPLVVNRPLVARTAPPPAPVLFAAKQSLLAQNHGRPLTASQMTDLRQKAPYAVMQGPPVYSSRPLASGPKAAKPAAKVPPRPNGLGPPRQGP